MRLLDYFLIFLPLGASLFTAIEFQFRPLQKWAALWSAAKRVESERWRFRTKTNAYRTDVQRVAGAARSLFVQKCDEIVKGVGESDGTRCEPPR